MFKSQKRKFLEQIQSLKRNLEYTKSELSKVLSSHDRTSCELMALQQKYKDCKIECGEFKAKLEQTKKELDTQRHTEDNVKTTRWTSYRFSSLGAAKAFRDENVSTAEFIRKYTYDADAIMKITGMTEFELNDERHRSDAEMEGLFKVYSIPGIDWDKIATDFGRRMISILYPEPKQPLRDILYTESKSLSELGFDPHANGV